MKIIHIKKIPFDDNALAINVFGVIFAVQKLPPADINHEAIHTAQMKEMLYIFFYLWYGIEWFIHFLRCRDSLKAYFLTSFEEEAYAHEDDLSYLKHRKHFAEFFK